jgi:hypothetical protein
LAWRHWRNRIASVGGRRQVRMWPVSRRVNKTGTDDDDPTLIDEVAA